jgi:hypothetical protein
MDEPILPDAASVNGTAAVGTAEEPGTSGDQARNDAPAAAGKVALTPTFLSGLAAAMRETAIRERERITGVVAEDAAAHIEKVRSRAAIETEELRRLAEEDVEHIEGWSTSEIERIKGEAAQKIDDRRSSLDEYLRQHDAIIDTEIEGVNAALRGYEATLDRFFSELANETDPSAIARRAGQLPAPPDLDEVRATARADAMSQFTESAPVADAATETTAEAQPIEAQPVEAVAQSVDSTEPVEAAESIEATASAESADQSDGTDGAMRGVMDDGLGVVAPADSLESTDGAEGSEVAAVEEEVAVAPEAVAQDETPREEVAVAQADVAEQETPREEVAVAQAETPTSSDGESADTLAMPQPVAVMDPDAQRIPSWPAPAPLSEAAHIAPSVDHTSAAVRLLRSVAPWTAPTHAGNRSQSDSE